MTKEELYEEFKEVTHFDDTDLDITVQKITNIEMDGRLIASGFDGIFIRVNIRNMPGLTYFHKEANHVDTDTE
jgi:hypothetical protein